MTSNSSKCIICLNSDESNLRMTSCGHCYCETCVKSNVANGNLHCKVCNIYDGYDALDELNDDITFFQFVLPPVKVSSNVSITCKK
ncbi:MAG: hypothetical protein GY932_10080 [Arcobacter sp.]|nr:hypothetical protein [Flavobacteriaceae bacterium]MCP4970928.1 hypothetical protein [Arcobacter sp.]